MILGYLRVSPGDGANEDRSSYQIQTDVIEGYARTRGIDKYGVQIFTDAGVSGAVKLSFRPAGAELLAAMAPGDTVIASKLDRMFRSASDALNMFDEFKKRGVGLVLFDMGAQSIFESAIAELIVTILAAVAQMERVRISERMAAGRQAKKARGGPIGTVPFGYRKVGEGKLALLEPDMAEQTAMGLMREWYQRPRCMSLLAISRELAAQNLLSRNGTPYTQVSIRRVVAESRN
jgi:DNA invertase Pin-like site-specific DNA recombinase